MVLAVTLSAPRRKGARYGLESGPGLISYLNSPGNEDDGSDASPLAYGSASDDLSEPKSDEASVDDSSSTMMTSSTVLLIVVAAPDGGDVPLTSTDKAISVDELSEILIVSTVHRSEGSSRKRVMTE